MFSFRFEGQFSFSQGLITMGINFVELRGAPQTQSGIIPWCRAVACSAPSRS